MSNKHISATGQLEAIAGRIVSAGDAQDLDAGIALAVERNPELYRVSCSEKIRPEIQREISEMLEKLEPSAREELGRIADEIYLRGQAESESDAWVFAVQRNPALFQQWRDQQKETFEKSNQNSSSTPGKVVASNAFESKAQALVTAGQVKSLDDAFGIVATSDPSAYSQYLKTLS